MSENITQLNEDLIKHDLKDLVHSSMEKRCGRGIFKALSDPIQQYLFFSNW